MIFEYDDNKNKSNITKHGLSFELASTIFVDENLLQLEDTRFDYGEIRIINIGQISNTEIIVTVITTDRQGNKRIISARKASKNESQFYLKNKNQPL